MEGSRAHFDQILLDLLNSHLSGDVEEAVKVSILGPGVTLDWRFNLRESHESRVAWNETIRKNEDT